MQLGCQRVAARLACERRERGEQHGLDDGGRAVKLDSVAVLASDGRGVRITELAERAQLTKATVVHTDPDLFRPLAVARKDQGVSMTRSDRGPDTLWT